MTVQDLGSIGEIIGAVAVLFTLIYLSLQTRQARLAAEETAKFASLQATHSIDNLYVDLSAPEVPIMDGSSAPFVFLLQQW